MLLIKEAMSMAKMFTHRLYFVPLLLGYRVILSPAKTVRGAPGP